eukprot:4206652-Pleurochrysis_carterae.AAC.1
MAHLRSFAEARSEPEEEETEEEEEVEAAGSDDNSLGAEDAPQSGTARCARSRRAGRVVTDSSDEKSRSSPV